MILLAERSGLNTVAPTQEAVLSVQYLQSIEYCTTVYTRMIHSSPGIAGNIWGKGKSQCTVESLGEPVNHMMFED